MNTYFQKKCDLPNKSKLPSVSSYTYSEKATKFWEIFTLLLSYIVPVKSKVKISQNFVAFSEYMNFNAELGISTGEYNINHGNMVSMGGRKLP